jgi:hypothetical protein
MKVGDTVIVKDDTENKDIIVLEESLGEGKWWVGIHCSNGLIMHTCRDEKDMTVLKNGES